MSTQELDDGLGHGPGVALRAGSLGPLGGVGLAEVGVIPVDDHALRLHRLATDGGSIIVVVLAVLVPGELLLLALLLGVGAVSGVVPALFHSAQK